MLVERFTDGDKGRTYECKTVPESTLEYSRNSDAYICTQAF